MDDELGRAHCARLASALSALRQASVDRGYGAGGRCRAHVGISLTRQALCWARWGPADARPTSFRCPGLDDCWLLIDYKELANEHDGGTIAALESRHTRRLRSATNTHPTPVSSSPLPLNCSTASTASLPPSLPLPLPLPLAPVVLAWPACVSFSPLPPSSSLPLDRRPRTKQPVA